MPFRFSDLPNRRLVRAVAVLVRGRGDGSCEASVPAAVGITRDGGYLNFSERLGGVYFEGAAIESAGGGGELRFDPRAPGLDYLGGTGSMYGILVLGLAGRGETDEAAVARLGRVAPDARLIWAEHCEREKNRLLDTEDALRDGLRDGFGTGGRIRFG